MITTFFVFYQFTINPDQAGQVHKDSKKNHKRAPYFVALFPYLRTIFYPMLWREAAFYCINFSSHHVSLSSLRTTTACLPISP